MNKILLPLLFVLVAVPLTAQERVRPRLTGATQRPEDNRTTASRPRTVSTNTASASETPTVNTSKPIWGDSAIVPIVSRSSVMPSPGPEETDVRMNGQSSQRFMKPTMLDVNPAASADLRSAHASGPTLLYRVGVGDVLDVRISNIVTRESTLFTVTKAGQLEYPLLAAPISVAGLTADEVARRLSTEIRVLQNPRISVTVRDYASHTVFVSGAADNPGRKVLQREAIPLFALLAEALPRADASTAILNRNGKETTLSLADNNDLSTLIIPGDVVKLSSPIKEFIYVGGDVVSPGEKEFRPGMTLTQALLASGGARTPRVTIAKRGTDGLLNTRQYDLQQINEGQAPDPILQAGDRIEVKRPL